MARSSQWFTEHPAHNALASAKSRLDGVDDGLREALSERGESEALDRATGAVTYGQGLLAVADPDLTSNVELDEVARLAEMVVQAIDAIEGDPDQWSSLEQAVDGLIQVLTPFAARRPMPAAVAQEIQDQLGLALRSRLEELEQEANTVKNELGQIESRRDELSAQTEEADATRRTELQTRLEELTAAVQAERERLDSLVPNFETRFEEDQGARREAWDELRTDLTARIEETRETLQGSAGETENALKERAEETAAGLRTRADELLDYLGEKKDEFEDLYRVLVDTGVSGGFNEEAKEQQEVANAWRVGAVIGGVVTTVIAIAAVAFASLADESLGTHLAALAVALASGGLTAYAARQSGHHRDREVESKRLALELAAFGPFVEGFVEEADGESETSASARANQARKDYIDRMFKGAERTSHAGEEAVISKDQISLVQSLIEAVLKVRGS